MSYDLPIAKLAEICARWNIKEMAVFGSYLTEHFNDESDIDLLFSLSDTTNYGYFEIAELQDEIEKIVGRKVDLVSKRGIELSKNHLRKEAILNSARVIYAA